MLYCGLTIMGDVQLPLVPAGMGGLRGLYYRDDDSARVR